MCQNTCGNIYLASAAAVSSRRRTGLPSALSATGELLTCGEREDGLAFHRHYLGAPENDYLKDIWRTGWVARLPHEL